MLTAPIAVTPFVGLLLRIVQFSLLAEAIGHKAEFGDEDLYGMAGFQRHTCVFQAHLGSLQILIDNVELSFQVVTNIVQIVRYHVVNIAEFGGRAADNIVELSKEIDIADIGARNSHKQICAVS